MLLKVTDNLGWPPDIFKHMAVVTSGGNQHLSALFWDIIQIFVNHCQPAK